MGTPAIATIILAAGQGTRMKSKKSKVLHEIGGLSMLGHVLKSAGNLQPVTQTVVVGDGATAVEDEAKKNVPGVKIAIQSPPRGTGDAVIQAMPMLGDFQGVVIVLYADTPLVTPQTMNALINTISDGAAVGVLGFRPDEPGAYGRLKKTPDGALDAIIEAKDASPEELKIDLVNSGVMAIDSQFLKAALPKIEPNNAKNEYYLTDLVSIARSENLTCTALEADTEEVIGVNSRIELAAAEKIFQNRSRNQAMHDGVTLLDPSSVYFSHDTVIESDVVIEPQVFFGPGVTLKTGAVVKAFSHLEGTTIGNRANAGPFARLRPGAQIGDDAKVGNFVEIKKATLGPNAKVSHLTYIGDAEIGADANIGAGTITCNYDGFQKHFTKIGKGSFIGSNSSLVAPVTVGDGAYVGSGSVITKDIPDNALAVARGRQSILEGWATRFRSKNKKA